jgi:DNA-binding transcriptional regulator YiaG
MKYESDILEMIHENALIDYKLGLITEEKMREYDEACLPSGTSGNNTAKADITHEVVNIEHPELVTA